MAVNLNRLREWMAASIIARANGEARLLTIASATSKDSLGQLTNDYSPRTTEFLPCTWKERHLRETEISLSSKASSVFLISIPVNDSGGNEITALESDKIELKTFFAGDAETVREFEIDSVINESGIMLTIRAYALK